MFFIELPPVSANALALVEFVTSATWPRRGLVPVARGERPLASEVSRVRKPGVHRLKDLGTRKPWLQSAH